MSESAVVSTLSNGLSVVVERVEGVRSAALSLLVPAGVAGDPSDAIGVSGVLQELTMRGAGGRSSREFSDALDRLGIQRDCSVGVFHARYSAAAVADRLIESLPLFADLVAAPALAADQLEPAKELILQEIDGLHDDPRSLVMIELRKLAWGEQLGRNTLGETDAVEAIDIGRVRDEHRRRFRPVGSILSIAGDIDPDRIVAELESRFAGWQGVAPVVPSDDLPPASSRFLRHASEQTHIGISCPTVSERSRDYYVARIANEVLSGGSSGRLFNEIREKRGLCYSVGTSYAGLREAATLLGYAGTSNDRAQATLDAFIEELNKLADGVTTDEVERQKVGLLASTMMSLDSTGARAAMNAADFFTRGRIRSVQEIVDAIAGVSASDVNAFLGRQPLGPFSIVTIGPHPLVVPGAAAMATKAD